MRTRSSLARRGSALLPVVLASLALAACGDDDESSSGGGGSAERATPPTVRITASGTPKDLSLEVTPRTVRPGAVTIEVENALDKGLGDAQMARVEGEHSEKEVLAEFAKATKGKGVADWFIAAGGPCCADKKGETASVTQDLREGTYYLLPGEKAKSPIPKFEVSGDDGPAYEPPAAKVIATEYSFRGQGVRSGEPLVLENGGDTWHHFIASRLKPGATIAQAKKFLMTEKGKPPFAGRSNAVESTVLDSGVSQTIDFQGEPGKYAFFCFIPDKATGGPPHVAKGMVSEVVVE